MGVKSAMARGLSSSLEPGLVLLTNQTFSAVSSLSLNNVFVPTYDFYMMNLIISSSTSENLRVRFRESGSDITTGYTGSGYEYAYNSTAGNLGAVNNGSTMNIVQMNTNLQTAINGYFISEKGSGGSVVSTFIGQGIGSGVGVTWGFATGTGSADGFSLTVPTGTITGTISLYGVNK